MFLVEYPLPRQQALLTQRDPHAPYQRLGRSMHRNFQATAYKKRIAIDNAIVTAELTTRGSLRFRNRILVQRSIGCESRHSFMDFAAALASKLEPHAAILALPLLGLFISLHPARIAAELRPHPSAVDVERLSGHERRVVAGKERHHADQILRHLGAADRLEGRGDLGELLVHAGEAGARLARHRAGRASEPRRDRVD